MLRYSSTVHVCYWNKKQTGKPEVRLEIRQCAEIKEVQLFSFTLEDFPWGAPHGVLGGAVPFAFSMIAISKA